MIFEKGMNYSVRTKMTYKSTAGLVILSEFDEVYLRVYLEKEKRGDWHMQLNNADKVPLWQLFPNLWYMPQQSIWHWQQELWMRTSSILGYVSTLHWWWLLSCWSPVFHYLCYWMTFLYHPLLHVTCKQ